MERERKRKRSRYCAFEALSVAKMYIVRLKLLRLFDASFFFIDPLHSFDPEVMGLPTTTTTTATKTTTTIALRVNSTSRAEKAAGFRFLTIAIQTAVARSRG